MDGKLIVIEGLDGCGKNTQTNLLMNFFNSNNIKANYLSFPNYSQASSALIKMYLNSEFGESPLDVNAYASSSFYAVDRFAAFKKYWNKYYFQGNVMVCDRYTTSNAIYQMCKLEKNLWDEYLTWLYDYEYNKMGLPKPNKVIYLKVPVEISQGLMNQRYQGDETKKDLHESNIEYLKKCEQAARYVAKKDGWCVIDSFTGDKMKTKNEVHSEIAALIQGGI